MFNKSFIVVQDGDIVDPKVIKTFRSYIDSRDIVLTDTEKYNFVGFVFTDDEVLVSFPKQTFSPKGLLELNSNKVRLIGYIRLLFQSIKMSVHNNNIHSLGLFRDYTSSFPFQEFLHIYNYYKAYGLFSDTKLLKQFGFNGRIAWKDTFNKSPKILDNSNILYIPMVTQKNTSSHTFISKCMAYIINFTINRYSPLIEGDMISFNFKDVDFSNKEMVISKLLIAKKSLFKDIHIQLVDHIISFFQNNYSSGGHYYLKVYSFNIIWQNIVRDYLENNFHSVDSTGKIIWRRNIPKLIIKNRKLYPDLKEGMKYSLAPDYYFRLNSVRYIFDAKYYSELYKLDYKQISYYFLLKDFENNESKNMQDKLFSKTISSLILPTYKNNYAEVHFKLNPTYNLADGNFSIYANYLNVIEAIHYYVHHSNYER